MAKITTQIQDIEDLINKDVSGVVSVSNSYTITTTGAISTVLVTTGNTNRTITLPAVAANTGRSLRIKKTDSGTGTVTIATNGGTIDGAAQNVLTAQYSFVEIVCDGANWNVTAVWDYVSTTGNTASILHTSANLIASPITLYAGNWEVAGLTHYSTTGGDATSLYAILCSVSLTSASNEDPHITGCTYNWFGAAGPRNPPSIRIVTTTTSQAVYLVGQGAKVSGTSFTTIAGTTDNIIFATRRR